MKKLIPALCMLLVAAALLGTSTYAWFSMNTQVEATGMKVKATAVGSLVIQQDAAPAATYLATSVAMTAPGDYSILDATHDAEQITGTFKTGLKTVSSANRTTILPEDGTYSGEYQAVETAVASDYYIDYTVHIASKDASLDDQKITATLTTATGTVFAEAVAVDFYHTTVDKANYIGTAHAAASNNSVVYGSDSNKIDIPQANGSASVVIIMRVYIDGAVSSVTTNNYSLDDITFGVNFVATAA